MSIARKVDTLSDCLNGLSPAKFLDKLNEKYGKRSQFVEVVFNEIQATQFQGYHDSQELDFDIGIRACTLQAMFDMNQKNLFDYPNHNNQFVAYSSKYWQAKPLKIAHNPRYSATQALNALFTKGATLDCERSADACVLKGVADAFHCNNVSKQFDELFHDDKHLELKHRRWCEGMGYDLSNLPTQFVDLSTYTILPGDRRYFMNLENYINKNPSGYASGEHAIYMGQENYQAMKLAPRNYRGMIEFLAYNYDLDQQAFKNFLYTEFGMKERMEWSILLPRVSDKAIVQIENDCREAFKIIQENLHPIVLTTANLHEHLDTLCDSYSKRLCKQIDEINTRPHGFYNKIRRIDVPALLQLAGVRLEVKKGPKIAP